MSEVSRLRIHRSLTATLMVLVFLLLLAFSIFWGIGFMLTWTAASIEEAQRTDSGLAKDFAALLQPHITPAAARAHSAQEINRIAFDFQQSHRNVSIYLLDLQGNVLWTPGEGEGLRTKSVDIAPVASFLNGDELPIYGTNPAGKRDSVFAAAAIDLYGAPGYVYLTLANNRYEAWTNFFLVSSSIRLFLILTIVVAVILGAIGALAIYFVTRRFRDVADVLRRYRGGDFSKRLDASGHDELAEVSDAVNSMLDTVEDQLAQLRKKDLVRRELISNIWHDLKTPVTAIRGHLELLEQRDAMLDSGQRLELVEILRGSNSMLQSMLVDLYDLGRLEAKDIEPATVRCVRGWLR